MDININIDINIIVIVAVLFERVCPVNPVPQCQRPPSLTDTSAPRTARDEKCNSKYKWKQKYKYMCILNCIPGHLTQPETGNAMENTNTFTSGNKQFGTTLSTERKHTKTFYALKTKRVWFAALDFLKLWSAGDGTPQLRTLDSETTSYQPFLSKSVH